MGCGNRRDLIRLVEYGLISNRSHYNSNHDNNTLALLNKIYVSNLITDDEYLKYKQLVLNNDVTFDELVELQRNRKQNSKQEKQIPKSNNKIQKLHQSKDKIIQLINQINHSIQDLEAQKHKIDLLLKEYINYNEKKAEEYISKKIDIEESIQNLNRRQQSLNENLEEIKQRIQMLEAEELELEAVQLQRELYNIDK